MQPLSSPANAAETNPAFTEAAEAWLRRTRNPHADASVLDAVQRWQERHTPVESADGAAPRAEAGAGADGATRAMLLHRVQGEQYQGTWPLTAERPLLIGRSGKRTSQVDIDLWPDAGISRRHAMLWFDGENWCIEDLRSKNGTFVNDTDIRGQRAFCLQPGMTVRLGRTVLRLTLGDSTASAAESHIAESQETEVPTLDEEAFE
ncbi:MAG: FHA domain-containing protein [Candidatus Tectimicrobiota bacterium]